VVLFQEVFTAHEDGTPVPLISELPGYRYAEFTALDSRKQTYPGRISSLAGTCGWAEDATFLLGMGIAWREGLAHTSIWSFGPPTWSDRLEAEEVHLETGLYTGSRDTEPRIAVVAHFVLEPHAMPLDVFVVNLHLTTLAGEREGSPERDERGSWTRLGQLDAVLYGIVSRYNQWRQTNLQPCPDGAFDRVPGALWLLAGDLNCTPTSPEVRRLELNFLDVAPKKGTGTKSRGAGNDPSVTVDYVFAGPRYVAFDPVDTGGAYTDHNGPDNAYRVSDHVPVCARVRVRRPAPADLRVP
jgi:endonuclease/exonuclease/phosphatase family metal-dependent hydrolase